ncbi:MAG: lytic murein transglycosylase [Thermodesulfobacteriota bacterium]
MTVLFPPLLFSCLQAAEQPPDAFAALRQHLVKDGFTREALNQCYENPRVVFETTAVGRFFLHQESTLNYGQFLTPESIQKARQYMAQQREWLDKAEAEYQVDKEIITAILLVETKLGTFVGRISTLNILSSMAALSDPDVREMLWQSLSDKTNMTREDYQKKADQKSRWAYAELTAFLTYVDREKIADPVDVPGSYAGAMGISQFMPSNILKLGVDGDKDGRINLFTHADAIFSVANYLRHYGWKPGISPADARKALFAYNHSTYYVDTLMQIFNALKPQP